MLFEIFNLFMANFVLRPLAVVLSVGGVVVVRGVALGVDAHGLGLGLGGRAQG